MPPLFLSSKYPVFTGCHLQLALLNGSRQQNKASLHLRWVYARWWMRECSGYSPKLFKEEGKAFIFSTKEVYVAVLWDTGNKGSQANLDKSDGTK